MVFCSDRSYKEVGNAQPGTDQRNPPPALGREVAPAQNRASPPHRSAHPGQVPGQPRPASQPSRPSQQAGCFKPAVAELLQQDPQAPAPVLLQRLQTLGFDGGFTILKDYLQAVRKYAV